MGDTFPLAKKWVFTPDPLAPRHVNMHGNWPTGGALHCIPFKNCMNWPPSPLGGGGPCTPSIDIRGGGGGEGKGGEVKGFRRGGGEGRGGEDGGRVRERKEGRIGGGGGGGGRTEGGLGRERGGRGQRQRVRDGGEKGKGERGGGGGLG